MMEEAGHESQDLGAAPQSLPMRMHRQCLPCSLDETEARTKYDEVMRAEWDNLMDADGGQSVSGRPR